MTNILLAAGVVIMLLAANIVMLISVLHRTRQRKGPYRRFFATANSSIRREAIKVLEALHTSVPNARAPSHLLYPDHWLFAEASDEHTGLLCGIAARPGPARLRIKKAVHERVRKADRRLEETMRAWLRDRPRRMAVQRVSDKKIVLLDRRDSESYLEYSNPPKLDYFDYYHDKANELLADVEPDSIWETAYDGTVSGKDSRFDEDTRTITKIVAVDMQELKGVRKAFQEVHLMAFGNDPPPPHSDDRERPVEVCVAEAELAHGIIQDFAWRLASKKSRRLNLLLRKMQDLRSATLRAFPAFAHALETAATESGASNAKAVGRVLHKLPNRVVRAMAECMTDMERNFAAMGVCACIEARAENVHETAFDWSFQDLWETDREMPLHPAPAYTRTLGRRSFRRKMEVVLGRDIALAVISAYDDAISARRLRTRVAAACREHGAALPELAEDMASVVEDDPYFTTSFGLRQIPKYRKMDKHETFRQAVDDAIASVLCHEIGSQSEEGASTSE